MGKWWGDNGPYQVAAGLAVLLAIVLIIYSITYKRIHDVEIMNRWWNSSIAVRYDERYWTTETYLEDVCRGFGENRSCSMETKTRRVRKTRTHTRCRDSTSGYELPVVYPPVPCEKHWGDYVTTGRSFNITYRISDTQDVAGATIRSEQWHDFPIGSRPTIELNIFGQPKVIHGTN